MRLFKNETEISDDLKNDIKKYYLFGIEYQNEKEYDKMLIEYYKEDMLNPETKEGSYAYAMAVLIDSL
jgi:hypothetical protein